ncbi:PREDICTED: tigger transposable element-derived protein 3-like [Rhagoletis zephyria]|uniref:tigger transposable element-derived protein 3-like n=1 Tax=Rhagoletis zephyria TaxID=28612 RepID=UPI0008117E01|nr:PREDICTED: tigger transposable element-derived protein 3-like [Rhagoletis zephyria]
MGRKNVLSLKEKIEIINAAHKENLYVRGAVIKFSISKTQAAEVLKNKDELKLKWCSGGNLNTKRRFIGSNGSQIDKLCLNWFAQVRNKRIPISGPIIKAKALEIAQQLGVTNFNASDGWLEKWEKRNNISFKSIQGEAASVNLKARPIFAKNPYHAAWL